MNSSNQRYRSYRNYLKATVKRKEVNKICVNNNSIILHCERTFSAQRKIAMPLRFLLLGTIFDLLFVTLHAANSNLWDFIVLMLVTEIRARAYHHPYSCSDINVSFYIFFFFSVYYIHLSVCRSWAIEGLLHRYVCY